MVLLTALLIAAQPLRPIRPFTTHGGQSIYPYEIATDTFEIVDASFDKNVVAFKHVYHLLDYPRQELLRGDDEAPIESNNIKPPALKSCEYPGLDRFPTSGLTYGIYDLAADKLKHAFTVYASTFGVCTDKPTAEATFQRYKKAMQSVGLDPAKTLPLMPLPGPKNGAQSFALTSKNKSFTFRAENIRRAQGEAPNECGDGPMITMGRVEKQGRLVWIRCQQDMIRSTAGGSIVYPYALVIGKQVVLVEHFRHASHESAARDRELWSFTKVLHLE